MKLGWMTVPGPEWTPLHYVADLNKVTCFSLTLWHCGRFLTFLLISQANLGSWFFWGDKRELLGVGGGTTSLVSSTPTWPTLWHISPEEKIIKRGEKSGYVEKSCIKSRGIESYLILWCLLEQLQRFGQRWHNFCMCSLSNSQKDVTTFYLSNYLCIDINYCRYFLRYKVQSWSTRRKELTTE